MKVYRESEEEFKPVFIRLDSQEELEWVHEALNEWRLKNCASDSRWFEFFDKLTDGTQEFRMS